MQPDLEPLILQDLLNSHHLLAVDEASLVNHTKRAITNHLQNKESTDYQKWTFVVALYRKYYISKLLKLHLLNLIVKPEHGMRIFRWLCQTMLMCWTQRLRASTACNNHVQVRGSRLGTQEVNTSDLNLMWAATGSQWPQLTPEHTNQKVDFIISLR